MQLTYDEKIDILDIKHIAGLTVEYTLSPSIFEVSDNNLMLKSLLPDYVKVNFTIDVIRLMSSLGTNQSKRHTKQSFFQYNYMFYSIPFRTIR